MPQLDTVTYRGQVTWLCRVFIGLYLVMTGDVLPMLNRILKIRSKKRERTRGDATAYDGERTRVETSYSGRLGYAAGSSTALLQERVDTQDQWVVNQVGTRTQSKRKSVSKAYRSHRMTMKMTDGILSRKLRSLRLNARGAKSGQTKGKSTGILKGTKPKKRDK